MYTDESHIIRRILDGETALYEHFLRAYGEQVFRLIVRVVDNREDAEELTQDVFLKAFEKLPSFRRESSFDMGICHRLPCRLVASPETDLR